MQVRYVGHACLSIEAAGKRILTDPWWNGPAYSGQWQPYPRPHVKPVDIENVDFIYVSHAHEDHMHVQTLRQIDRRAALVIPRMADPAMFHFLRSLGFARVIEIGHGQTKTVAPGLELTVYRNKLDSILIVHADGRTLVNANDALHATSRHVMDHLCAEIQARHPSIDMLFSGHGGASWFPNCIELSDALPYDGFERERVLADNFIHLLRTLNPRMSFPIGSTYVVVDERMQWMNALRFEWAERLDQLCKQSYLETQCMRLMPGDRIAGDRVLSRGAPPFRASEAEAEVRAYLQSERHEIARHKELSDEATDKLVAQMRRNAGTHARRVLARDQRLLCRIDLRDVPEVSFLVQATRNAIQIERCDRLRLAPMTLTTRLGVLQAWVREEFGFESITIGHGATLQLRERDLPLRNALIRLLSAAPLRARGLDRVALWLRYPWRSLDCWRRNAHWLLLALRMRTGRVQRSNDIFSTRQADWAPAPDHALRRRA